jgi:mannose-6-phosphate isomerase-like protein (cupin superfamily)
MSDLNSIFKLIDVAKAHLQRGKVYPGAIGDEISRVLALLQTLPPLAGVFSPNTHPLTRHLDAAYGAAAPGTADVIEALRPVARILPWTYGYDPRADFPGLENAMGWAEIIGPAAPFRSESICLGFTLIDPETLYPAHAHPAVELYYVVAGNAQWTAAGVTHTNPPGAFILHPSEVVHSMKTGGEPLLALYTWSGGDIVTTSYFTHE